MFWLTIPKREAKIHMSIIFSLKHLIVPVSDQNGDLFSLNK